MKRRFNIKRKISKFMAAALLVNTLAFNVGVLDVKAQNAGNVINLAASQVGYHEKASYSNLDDFNANNGSANYNKYARDLGIANGQPWCASFVWWCMASNGMPQSIYPQSAYVPTIKNWFAQRSMFVYRGGYTPKAGDYIIFGDCDHVGIVEHVSGNYVNTIEGNTSNAVKRHSYPLDSSYILGYGIVNYSGDFTAPTVSNVVVSDISESGYTITCTVDDAAGLSYVAFPTWTHANGQDDLDNEWFLPSGRSYGSINGNVVTFRVDASQHNNERGMYATHIYAQDVNGNKVGPVLVDVNLDNIPVPNPTPEVNTDDILNDAVDVGGEIISDITSEENTDNNTGITEDVAPEVDSEATTETTTETVPEVNEDIPAVVEPETSEETAPEVVPDENLEVTPEVVPDENPDVAPEVNPDVAPEVVPEDTQDVTDNVNGEDAIDSSTNEEVTTEEVPEEVVDDNNQSDINADNVTINNVTNNNITNNTTTNNITNNVTNNNTYNYTNEGDTYYTVQYPTDAASATNAQNSSDSMSNWANDFLQDLMATELANYIPAGFEVTEWEGESTAPACEEIIDDAADFIANNQTPSDIQMEEVSQNTYETEGQSMEEGSYYEADREESTDDDYYISDKKPKEDSEGFVMYTTVNGKKYKLTISFK